MAPKRTFDLLPAQGTQALVDYYAKALIVHETKVSQLKVRIEGDEASSKPSGTRATRSKQHPLHHDLEEAEKAVEYFKNQKIKAVHQYEKDQAIKQDAIALERLTANNTKFNQNTVMPISSLVTGASLPHPGQTTATWSELVKSPVHPSTSADQLADTINRANALLPTIRTVSPMLNPSTPLPMAETDFIMSSPLSSVDSLPSFTSDNEPLNDKPKSTTGTTTSALEGVEKLSYPSTSKADTGSEADSDLEAATSSADMDSTISTGSKAGASSTVDVSSDVRLKAEAIASSKAGTGPKVDVNSEADVSLEVDVSSKVSTDLEAGASSKVSAGSKVATSSKADAGSKTDIGSKAGQVVTESIPIIKNDTTSMDIAANDRSPGAIGATVVISEDEIDKLIVMGPKPKKTAKNPRNTEEQNPSSSIPKTTRKTKPKAQKRERIIEESEKDDDKKADDSVAEWGTLPVNSLEGRQLQEKARMEIQSFLGGTRKSLRLNVRKILRTYSDFVPEAGALAYELSIHILTTRSGNISCRHHQLNDKSTNGEWDGMSGKPQHGNLTGIPWDRRFNSGKTASAEPLEGFAHCGCNLDDIVYDFFIFKDSRITSTNPSCAGLEEGWNTQHLNPRVRGLFINTLQRMSGIKDVHDIFIYSWNIKLARFIRRSQSDILSKRIAHLTLELGALRVQEAAKTVAQSQIRSSGIYHMGEMRDPMEVTEEMKQSGRAWVTHEEFEDMTDHWEGKGLAEEEVSQVLKGAPADVAETSRGNSDNRERKRERQTENFPDEGDSEAGEGAKRLKTAETDTDDESTKKRQASRKGKEKMRESQGEEDHEREERRRRKHEEKKQKRSKESRGTELETPEARRIRKEEKRARKEAKQLRKNTN